MWIFIAHCQKMKRIKCWHYLCSIILMRKKQEEDGVTLRVEQSQFINAVELLRLNGYPHRQFTTADKMFPANQLVVSPREEQQKINF